MSQFLEAMNIILSYTNYVYHFPLKNMCAHAHVHVHTDAQTRTMIYVLHLVIKRQMIPEDMEFNSVGEPCYKSSTDEVRHKIS